MPEMVSLKKAREIVLDHTQVLPSCKVDLLDACGRVAAADLTADIDNAPFAHVAMDGYALRADQIADASEEAPVELDVVAEIAAGDDFTDSFGEGQCVRIMTGAKLPACADTCVKYEIVGVVSGEGKTGGRVSFTAPAKAGQNVRAAGEEASAGEVVVHAGEVVNSAGVGFLAGCGIVEVPVFTRPRVAIMATGSELVPHDQVPHGAKIRNSNAPAIAACVREAGGIPEILPIVRDTYEELRDAVKGAVADHDMVITTGGAANGDYDFIKQVVSDLGQAHLTLVNMRPGKAETYGTVDGTPVVGLPGNPAAAYIGFQMLVRPALRKMQGYSHFERMRVKARLACDIRAKKDARMTLMRAVMTRADGGIGYEVAPLDKQSSGLFGPLQKSNALIVVERGDIGHAAGEDIDCLLLDIDEECVL